MKMRALGAIAAMLLLHSLTPDDCAAAIDASRVVGPEKCAVCHKAEYKLWQTTTHATMYTILHKKDAAQSVAAAMGVRTIKTESVCMDCHFTPVPMAGKITSTAGVSCESCHGPARDWINVHNDLGTYTRENEPADHKKNRLAAAVKAGMVPPAGESLYDLIGNCYSCHTVPNERLVNVGAHSSGSTFDVLERVDTIRHNFLDSHGAVNAELPAAEKRRIYLIGTIQQLRTSLRNAGLAKEDGRFSREAGKRVKSALEDIKAVQDQLQLPELQEMVLAAKGLALRPGNANEVQYAVNKISSTAKSLLARYDDRKLSPLQALLDAPQQQETAATTAARGAVADTVAEPAAPATAPSGESTGKGVIKAIRNAVSPPRATSAAAPAMKRHIRPPSGHRTIGPSSCSMSCHNAPNTWWETDKHFAAADRLLNDDPKAVKIARLYGLSEKEMKNGQNICMDCHGTVVSGKEARDAADGVGCESCHGAAGDWIKVHNQNNTFNQAAFAAGMVPLSDVSRRARVCTGCHYVNEPRLISSGHGSYTKFDYVQALNRIKHWKNPLPANEAWSQAVTAAIASAGPVPAAVNLAAIGAVAEPKAAPAGVAEPQAQAAAARSQVQTPAALQTRSPDLHPVESIEEAPQAAAAVRSTSRQPLAIPPVPPIEENASIPELLRIAKQRLETLYQLTGSSHDR